MCGIAGFIGRSKNPRATFDLSHALLIKTESRGEHATGFWAAVKEDGPIIYDKEPVKSSIYATRSIWTKEFADRDCDLMVSHCRFTSLNVGNEKFNKNNHPHVSSDFRVALVHNGKIPEYKDLRSRYHLRSDCDSEILLRMYESQAETPQKDWSKDIAEMPAKMAPRLMGLKDIFARVNYGAMAVAIAERGDDGTRYLWLLRNDERPLHVVDLRKTIGQVFFCSTAEIWRSAIDSCPSIKPYLAADHRIIEFESDQVWGLMQEPDGRWVKGNIRKFKVSRSRFYDYKEPIDGFKFYHPTRNKPVDIITRLDDGEEVKIIQNSDVRICGPVNAATAAGSGVAFTASSPTTSDKKKRSQKSQIMTSATRTTQDFGAVLHTDSTSADSINTTAVVDETPEVDMAEFLKAIDDVEGTVKSIRTSVENLVKEQSITEVELDRITEDIKLAYSEFKSVLLLLKESKHG